MGPIVQETHAPSSLLCLLGTVKVFLQCPHGGHKKGGPNRLGSGLPHCVAGWRSLGCGERASCLVVRLWSQRILLCTLGTHEAGVGQIFLVQPIRCGKDVMAPPSAAHSANSKKTDYLAQNACPGTSILGPTASSAHEKNFTAYNARLHEA